MKKEAKPSEKEMLAEVNNSIETVVTWPWEVGMNNDGNTIRIFWRIHPRIPLCPGQKMLVQINDVIEPRKIHYTHQFEFDTEHKHDCRNGNVLSGIKWRTGLYVTLKAYDCATDRWVWIAHTKAIN